MKVTSSLAMLFITGNTLFCQENDMNEDNTPLQLPKFQTNGLYIAVGTMASEIGTYSNSFVLDTTSYLGLHSSFFCQAQLEFKHNLAVNLTYTFSPAFLYNLHKMRVTGYELGGHFPCYRSFKKKGIYIDSGFSLTFVHFYNSPTPTSDQHYKGRKYFMILNALGYEYKFKHIQLYTMTQLCSIPGKNHTLSETLWDFGTINYIIGMRIKLPPLYKSVSDRYHWI